MVQLRTLGRLELVSGEPTALHVLAAQPKPLALLAYVALATPRGQHSRDSLLALFWPELGDEDARRAPSQALHRIRYHVGDELLKSEREGKIGISDDGTWCDAIAFEQALDAGTTSAHSRFIMARSTMPSFVSNGSPDFEQWVDLTRTRLRNRAEKAAAQLADTAKRAGERASEVRWATQACELAPEDESRVRALMTARAPSGDRAGALRAFKRFAKLMEREYDAEPAKETIALASSMRAAPDEPAVVGDSGAIEREVPTPAVVEPALVPAPALDPPMPAAPLAPARAGASRSRWRIAGIAAAVLILAVAAARYLTSATPSVDRLLVADFHNHTRDSLLAGAITEAMRADLSQSRQTRVMSRAQVQAVLEHMRQPAGGPWRNLENLGRGSLSCCSPI